MALTAITLFASAVAAQDTANYFTFYNALSRVKLNLISLEYTPRSYYAAANINFTVENPTSYRGLAVQFFEPSFIVNASGTGSTTQSQAVILPQHTKGLEPGKIVKIAFPFNSTWDQSWTSPQFDFTINLSLSTFLDQAAAVTAVYVCQSTGGPSTCVQEAVGIEATGPSGGRGGGV
jgi:hypothetical protein